MLTIQMTATEQYGSTMVLFISLESVDEILKCDHSDESY